MVAALLARCPRADRAGHEPGAARPARGAAVPARPAPGSARRCAPHAGRGRRSSCSRHGRSGWRPGSASTTPRGRRSWRCAVSSTACRWPSSWPPVGWRPWASTGCAPAWAACSTWSSVAARAGPARSATPTSSASSAGRTTCSDRTKPGCSATCAVFVGGFDLAVAERVADELGVPVADRGRRPPGRGLTADRRRRPAPVRHAEHDPRLRRGGAGPPRRDRRRVGTARATGRSSSPASRWTTTTRREQLQVVARVLTELANLRAARRIALATGDVAGAGADRDRAPPGDRLGDAARAVRLGP